MNKINATVTHQIGIIEGKTSTQIESINNTATSQISAINSTALSQIDAINNTTTNQIKNMTVKYSDMCRTLGIEHEGMINITRNKNVPIDVRKYKYIKFELLIQKEAVLKIIHCHQKMTGVLFIVIKKK